MCITPPAMKQTHTHIKNLKQTNRHKIHQITPWRLKHTPDHTTKRHTPGHNTTNVTHTRSHHKKLKTHQVTPPWVKHTHGHTTRSHIRTPGQTSKSETHTRTSHHHKWNTNDNATTLSETHGRSYHHELRTHLVTPSLVEQKRMGGRRGAYNCGWERRKFWFFCRCCCSQHVKTTTTDIYYWQPSKLLGNMQITFNNTAPFGS